MRLYLFNGIFMFIFWLCCVGFIFCFITSLTNSSLTWSPYFKVTSHCIPIWMSSDTSLADRGWFIYRPHPSTLSLFLCRERGIPCSSLEWVTHLIGPSTARHFLNSASTVWTRARRWVKRLYSSHWMRSLAGADQSLFMGLVLSRHCVADCCACWGFWGLNIVCKALKVFLSFNPLHGNVSH